MFIRTHASLAIASIWSTEFSEKNFTSVREHFRDGLLDGNFDGWAEEHQVAVTFREELHQSIRENFRDGLLEGNFEDFVEEHLVERTLRDIFADDFPGVLFRAARVFLVEDIFGLCVAEHLVE